MTRQVLCSNQAKPVRYVR
uniref:Uncharacterized protein n=1 Tax=Rhizophora mucronata TaxID=61149 RepID=A0A2P2NQL3_RHIMU